MEFKPKEEKIDEMYPSLNAYLNDTIAYPGELSAKVNQIDEWHCDGTYIWQWGKERGLVRLNREPNFFPIPETMIRNESLKEWNVVSFFVLNQKVFIRTDAHEDQPFVTFDIDTLQPCDGDPFTCK